MPFKTLCQWLISNISPHVPVVVGLNTCEQPFDNKQSQNTILAIAFLNGFYNKKVSVPWRSQMSATILTYLQEETTFGAIYGPFDSKTFQVHMSHFMIH